MRRFLLAAIAIMVGLTCALSGAARSVSAQSYGPDLTLTADAFDCGHSSSFVASNAFDDSTATAWASSQTGASVKLAACIGQDFGGSVHQVRQVWIKQGANAANQITSAIVQNSSDCAAYNSVQTLTLAGDSDWHDFAIGASAAYRCWRVLANANTPSGAWQAVEIQMMELISWPTDTPGPSSTPTITLTPSITPSPTPDINSFVTSTQGLAMVEVRSTTYGEKVIAGFLMAIALIMVLFLALWLWGPRPNA